MDKILFINACVRPDSRTLELAKCVLSRLEGQVEELRLDSENIPPLSNELLEKRNALIDAGNFSHPMLRYARQLAEADTLVVAAPYWDLIFPATVRLWFEHICVTGLTFRYSPEGFPVSLCKAKRLIYVTTAGGPIFANFGYDYSKAVCEGYFGIHDCCCIKAENLDIVGADVKGIMDHAKTEIREIL